MSILLLTAAQSGLITSLDGNLDNVFTFGAQNSGTGGTVLTALSGYSIDTQRWWRYCRPGSRQSSDHQAIL
jgi:hypothetical protein